jgi:signal transduction histidine kinase/DNA-binding response OmpR family regulator
MTSGLLVVRIIAIFLLYSCADHQQEKSYTIGFSQCVESDLWRKTMLEGMKKELSFHPNLNFLYRQAGGNSQLQIKQVNDLIAQGIDLLIISPNEAEPLTPIVEEIFNKGIPVIVVDRKISSSLYTAYIGADNYEIGKMAGIYAAQLLQNQGNIIEVTGLPKSSPAIERHNGFADAIKSHSSLKIIHTVNGQWIKQEAQSRLVKDITELGSADLVYAHNDNMALGAYEVFNNLFSDNKVKIIGVDGLPGSGGGMQMVSDKIITATLLYPTGGEEAIQIATKVLNREEIKKDNYLQTSVVDSTNVRILSLQASKVISQQKEIERQQSVLSEQQRIYNNQRTFLYVLISTLVLAILLGGVSFYSLRENRKINKRLKYQNIEILDQKNQLIEMSAKAQIANEAKVNFFTNISHEFRTPLTLILAPLEELESTKNLLIQKNLSLIHKNVIRLLRMVNQLIDFRKIEVDKMKLRASQNNLIEFVNEIMQSYKSITHKRNIDLRLITNERQLNVWFDATMIDKVLFNLLSNAFKFTKENGFINVYVNKNEPENVVSITVEDNGVGMTQDAQQHAFEVFYQGEFENYKGSGLGLALSKEFIQLHKGQIEVISEKWKGTTFKIKLPLGKEHLTPEEIVQGDSSAITLYEQEKIYTADLEIEDNSKTEVKDLREPKEVSILIIEDNTDLRNFLAEKFYPHYEILEASNGQSALQQGFDNIPDLIICDIVIPGKDGLSLTNIFKSDIRTSHIPIILLTAKTNIEQQIEGMKNKADAYLTKPFNVQFLEENIKSLLANRNRLKEHFTSDISSTLKTQTINKLDRKFVNEFTSYVESNIANDDLSVEDVCKNIGVSKVQLYRKVKALLGINVSDYILNSRLSKAKYMLQHENLTISEIAFKVGFSSPAYFSTVFKSKFGVTPKGFKEK